MNEVLINFAERLKTPVNDLTGASRRKEIAMKRKVIWYVLYSSGMFTYQTIAELFNRNSHSTVISGIRSVEGYISIKDKSTDHLLRLLGWRE